MMQNYSKAHICGKFYFFVLLMRIPHFSIFTLLVLDLYYPYAYIHIPPQTCTCACTYTHAPSLCSIDVKKYVRKAVIFPS